MNNDDSNSDKFTVKNKSSSLNKIKVWLNINKIIYTKIQTRVLTHAFFEAKNVLQFSFSFFTFVMFQVFIK